MFSKKYIKKIKIGSKEWLDIKNIDFDENFYLDKNNKKGNYRLFFLNNDNRKKLKIDSNYELKNINYFNLREYQKEALEHILLNRRISLNLPVRFGKSYLSVAAILNNKENTIFFVDKNMIENIKNIFLSLNEENIFIFHGNKNRNIFEDLNDKNYKIIITTEETFISRCEKEKEESNFFKNMKFIKNIVVDEFHSFLKSGDMRYKKFKKIFHDYLKNLDLIILISATPINEKIIDIFKAINILDYEFTPSDWVKKCTKYDNFSRKINIKNHICLNGILNEVLYRWEGFNPVKSLKIIDKYIEQNEKVYEHINNENNNNIIKQKIIDDIRIYDDNEKHLPMKIEKAIEIIKENNFKKIVIFTKFKKSQEKIICDLENKGIISKYINSDISISKRSKIINEFQNSSNLNTIIVQIDTAIGITLDKANLAIVICDEYEPQKYHQALGRIVSSDIMSLELKYVYWIYDKKHNSKNALGIKIKEISKYGIDYDVDDDEKILIICESSSDIKFIKNLLYENIDNCEFCNKNKFSINEGNIRFLSELKFNYLVICDNDQIKEDLKLEKNKANYLTYNDLFDVDNEFRNIEEIINKLGGYDDQIIKLIKNCEYEKDTKYKELINLSVNNEKETDVKKTYLEFMNSYLKNENYKDDIENIYKNIKKLWSSDINKSHGKKIKNIIKSYFMDNINPDFFLKYSKEVTRNLCQKIIEIKNNKNI